MTLSRQRDQAINLLRDLVDDEPCDYDHHDYCQSHRLYARPCFHAQAIELIALVDGEL